jgi:hypothetical protein
LRERDEDEGEGGVHYEMDELDSIGEVAAVRGLPFLV